MDGMASLAGMMSAMGGGGEKDREILLKDEAAQAWREKFIPIPDLKAGDKVRWKSGCQNARHGDYHDVFEVFSVLTPPLRGLNHSGSNHTGDINDFTLASWDHESRDGTFELYCFDSRRFERVE